MISRVEGAKDGMMVSHLLPALGAVLLHDLFEELVLFRRPLTTQGSLSLSSWASKVDDIRLASRLLQRVVTIFRVITGGILGNKATSECGDKRSREKYTLTFCKKWPCSAIATTSSMSDWQGDDVQTGREVGH